MRASFNALGYRSSKSDRTVLKWFFIICLLVVSAIGIAVLLLFWTALWSPQVQQDRVRLDSILDNQKIDGVEFVSLTATNFLIGEEALKLVISLGKTNRIASGDWTKLEGQHVRLLSGTNEVCAMFLVDDGTWKFENYSFRLRQ